MMEQYQSSGVPVITIDGPGGAGKGTIGQIIARTLGWHFLDSGSLYRLVALAAQNHTISLGDETSLETLAAHLDVQFSTNENGKLIIMLEGENVTDAIRSEECGTIASKVAAIPRVRQALLERQRAFREVPGLVADGRDMGSVVFPDAEVKVFMTASAEERAQRRYKQLKEKGLDAKLSDLLDDIVARDERDMNRSISPLVAADDAVLIDTTEMSIDEVVGQVLGTCQERLSLTVKNGVSVSR